MACRTYLRKQLRFALSCSILLATAARVAAQQPEFQNNLPELPETVIEGRQDSIGSQGTAASGRTMLESPNFTPTELDQTGSSITVITAEQISQRGGQQNVAEVLRGLAGVDVVRQSTPGSVTSVFLRGAGAQHTKVLIDNIPANDPTSPSRAFDFANLSVDNIERIEIIRGPQSVLYGSDAIGGVINIITKKGSGPLNGRIASMGGSYGTADVAMNANGSNRGLYYSAGGSYFDTAGFSAAAANYPGNTEKDGFQLGTFSARTGWEPSEQFSVDVVLRYNQGLSDIDNGGGPFQDDPDNSTTIQQTVVGLRIHSANMEGWYEQTTSFYVSDVLRGFRSPGGFFGDYFAHYSGNTQQVDSRHTLHLLDTDWIGHSITAGGQYQTEIGSYTDSFSAFPNMSNDDGAVYGQSVFRVGESWFTTVGVRSDHYNLYGAQDTYRATSLYRVPELNTGIRSTIGTGFRAPSISEKLDPNQGGNPLLQPEYSKGWDVGIEQPIADGAVVPSVTYFRNDFRNFIDFNQMFFQTVNLDYARTSGIEFNTLFLIGERTTITTAYTYTDTEAPSNATPPTLGTPAQLIRRPRNKFGVVCNRQMLNNRLNWNVNMVYVGERDDVTGFPNTRVVLPSYFLVNTGFTFDMTRRIQLFGRVDNVLNEDYEEVYGFATAKLSGYAGAALKW